MEQSPTPPFQRDSFRAFGQRKEPAVSISRQAKGEGHMQVKPDLPRLMAVGPLEKTAWADTLPHAAEQFPLPVVSEEKITYHTHSQSLLELIK